MMELPPRLDADKATWRRWAQRRRAEVDFGVVSAAICDHLVASGLLRGTVLTYLAMAGEVDLAPLFELDGVQWAITRTPARGPLTVHPVGGEMEPHRFGFSQPAASSPQIDERTLDVLLLPGLAFDRHGGRIGRGKGYIDGLLARVRSDAVTVGVVPEVVVVERLPMDANDRPVKRLVSELGSIDFALDGHGER
jgi:5-formyltetrahydrofolate cyclo-ligase